MAESLGATIVAEHTTKRKPSSETPLVDAPMVGGVKPEELWTIASRRRYPETIRMRSAEVARSCRDEFDLCIRVLRYCHPKQSFKSRPFANS